MLKAGGETVGLAELQAITDDIWKSGEWPKTESALRKRDRCIIHWWMCYYRICDRPKPMTPHWLRHQHKK